MKEIINNKQSQLLLLLLISILFNNFINSLFIIFVFLFAVIKFKKKYFKFDKYYLLPVFLFLTMLLSLAFSVNKDETVKALIKELPLLVIPFIFVLINKKEAINKQLILKYYSYSILFFSIFFILKATFRYLFTKDVSVFFFHELVSKELNAVHISVFVTIAFFYFLTKYSKKRIDYFFTFFLFLFLILLSSKIILFTTLVLVAVYFFFYSKSANKMRLRNVIMVAAVISLFFYFGKIKDKIQFEFNIKADSNIGHTVINKIQVGTNIISMKEAWYNEKFNQTDYFSGASFRIYQARLFFEFLKEEPIFWTGFGLNASYKKIDEKGIHYNVFQGNDEVEGYQKKNFHNQYIQTFAELGIVGFLLLVFILGINLKNGLKSKNFMHIVFAILMISLFLTETFLWRQRGVVFFTVSYCLFNCSWTKFNLEKIK